MIREPWFWRSHSISAKIIANALSPVAGLYDLGQRMRWRTTRPIAPDAPIICVGNASLGGVGKTPFALALFDLLQNAGLSCQFLTRGYGGSELGPLMVNPGKHNHSQTGDEALLLARRGPVWVSRNRSAGAQAASNEGAGAIIMDDGFQNPTVEKSFSILLLDAADPGGNGRVFPAGPLREPIARAQARADLTILVGPDETTAQNAASQFKTSFAAWLEPIDAPPAQRVVAFSGIGKPDKFFDMLKNNGFELADAVSFPDHHPFTDQNLAALQKRAAQKGAPLITTEKDSARLPLEIQREILVFPVRMRINQPTLLTEMILTAIDRRSDLRDKSLR